jgi:hypothetical protein
MMADTMFASGKDAHLSTFNRGSEGSVTDEKSKTNLRRKRCRIELVRCAGLIPCRSILTSIVFESNHIDPVIYSRSGPLRSTIEEHRARLSSAILEQPTGLTRTVNKRELFTFVGRSYSQGGRAAITILNSKVLHH